MDYTGFDDQTLLRLIHREDQHALEALYDRYHRLVYTIAYNALGSTELAEEVTQDVFWRVWKHAESYDVEQARVVTWIASVTRHRAIDILRQQRTRPESKAISWAEVGPEDPADDQNVEADVELRQRQERIRLAVARLPEEQKQALGLAYFRGMSHQEIADTLGEPLGTVKTRIRLGIQKLRNILSE